MAREVDSIVSLVLADSGVNLDGIERNYVVKNNGKYHWEQVEVIVMLNESASLYTLRDNIRHSLSPRSLTMNEEALRNEDSIDEFQISVYHRQFPVYQILLKKKRPATIEAELPEVETPQRPKIALVVDDVGYDLERAVELLNLNRVLTVSIFPKLRYSRHIAEIAHDKGYDVMMHLPMQPGAILRRNPGFVTSDMSEKELRKTLAEDLESIPYVVGVNNHQGSKMTRDPQAMARVAEFLVENGLYFIDSRTTPDSVAYKVAKNHGLRAAENDMFLDNEKDVAYIKGRLELLIERAEKKGKAIGICHVHPATIEALRQIFPVMEQRNIELVPASELVN